MTWIVFALLAPALYTTVTFIDKYLLESEVKDYNAMPIYMGIVAAIAGSLFFIAAGYPILPLKDTLIVLTTGILTTASLVFYFKALSFEETSTVNIFFQTFPIISLLLAFIFLGEKISFTQFIGFVLVLSSSIGISLKKTAKLFEFSPALVLILIQNTLWAISGVLMKYAINVQSFSYVLSYESFGIAIGAVLLFIFKKEFRQAFFITNKALKDRARVTIFINEGIGVIAKASTFFAFSLGPVGLVSVLESTQGIFAIIYGALLTLFLPKIFRENLERSVLTKKITFALLAIIGVMLLS